MLAFAGRRRMRRSSFILTTLMTFSTVFLPDAAHAQRAPVSCDTFASQEDAQNMFDTSDAPLPGLDEDGDGVACEDLPSRSASSSTTTGTGAAPTSITTTTATGAPSTDEPAAGDLADTGPSTTWLVLIGGFLLIGGGVVVNRRLRA